MFMTAKKYYDIKLSIVEAKNAANVLKSVVQSNSDMIRCLMNEVERLRKLLNVESSSPSIDYQQRLTDYQKEMDAMAGQVISDVPREPKRNAN